MRMHIRTLQTIGFSSILAMGLAAAQGSLVGTVLNDDFSTYTQGASLEGQTATNGNAWTAIPGYDAVPTSDLWAGSNGLNAGRLGGSDWLIGARLSLTPATEGTLVLDWDTYVGTPVDGRYIRTHFQEVAGGEISVQRIGSDLVVGSSIGITGGTYGIGTSSGWVHTKLTLALDGSSSSLFWDTGSSSNTINLGAFADPNNNGVFNLDRLQYFQIQSNATIRAVDNFNLQNVPEPAGLAVLGIQVVSLMAMVRRHH